MIRRFTALAAIVATLALSAIAPARTATRPDIPGPVAVSLARPLLFSAPAPPPSVTVPASQPPVVRPILDAPDVLWRLTAALRPAPPRPAPAVASRSNTRTTAPAGTAARALAWALTQVGKPYVWDAAGPNAYDCSGLVVAAWRTVGIYLPHYTGDLLNRGMPVSRANLRPGDLVFPSQGHVGIVVDSGHMVAAPHTGSYVQVQTIYAFYAGRRIV